MKSITLISDWKLRDPYIAMFKGRLMTLLPDVVIFDISHAIELSNIAQTAFILKNSYTAFPEKSLHIILTDTSLAKDKLPVLVEYGNHFFLGEDNGVFSLMFGDEPVNASQYNKADISDTFLDKLLETAAWYFTNSLEAHMSEYPKLKRKLQQEAYYIPSEKKIAGRICYIDTCCNAVTNIPIDLFEKENETGKFKATISSTRHLDITKYYDYYNPAEMEPFFVINQLGYLEIAMYRGNIAILGDLKVGDEVEILFEK